MEPKNEFEEYQDPLMAADGKPAKKKSIGSTVAIAAATAIIFFLFGAIGGLICCMGYCFVYGIAKSKMPLVAKIILGTIVGLIFLILLFVFIVYASSIQANI